MNNILLILNLIPEESQYFFINQVDEEDLTMLKDIHGLVGNSDSFTEEQWEKFNKIQAYLSSKFYPTEEIPVAPEYQGKWAEFRVDYTKLPELSPKAVFLTGFIL